MNFKSYPNYKDSGIEWLGKVPEHWQVANIKRSTYLKGRVGWKGLTSNEFEVESYAYLVTGTDFKNKYVEWSSCYQVNEERFNDDPYIQLKNNDLLITKDGTIGKLAVVRGLDKPACLNSGIFLIRPEKYYLSEYMYYILKSSVFQNFFEIHSTGSTILHLYQNVFEKFSFAYPSLNEQKKIVSFLDSEIFRIDNLIAKQEKLIEKLEEHRKSVISHAVTKGLDPNVLMKDSYVDWLGEVPEHWILKNYKFACKIYRGKFGHRPRNDPAFYDGEYPFIQTGDIARANKFIEKYSQTLNELGKSVSQKFPKGTLVMAIAANIGDTAILDFEAYAPDSVVGFKPSKNIDLEFLRFSFTSALQALKQTSVQSTQSNLNVERIGALKAVFPPFEEQVAISNYLNEENLRIDGLITKQNQLIEKLREYRNSIISYAVTGKIDVRDLVA